MSGTRRIAPGCRTVPALRDLLLTTTALVAAVTLGGKDAAAQLSGLQVGAGQATMANPSATSTVITQTTNKAILNWQTFSIAAGNSVTFQQPSSGAIALNRVLGANVSNISGSLAANGQVWLVNPSGIFFGAGAQVNVGGLLATTADINDSDFMAGNYKFGIPGNPNASVINQGRIQVAPGGSAILAGAVVNNQGLIQADLGTVVLGGGKTFAVDFQGDKLLSFQVTAPVDQTPTNPDGTPVSALVSNSGTLSANGGTVLLTARAAKNIIDNVINTSGIVEAKTASMVNGEIVLDGGDTGAVTVSGSLDASGKNSGETGGTVKVLGDQVTLTGTAVVDASGDAGGGTVLIGGDFHGAGPDQNASTTTIAAGAVINADAITTGNGGQVAIWSQQSTAFDGSISANGGSLSGNGGTVETSSANALEISGTVSAIAPNGTAGSWLLDPVSITIVAGNGGLDRDDGTTSTSSGTQTTNVTGDNDSDDNGLTIGAGLIGGVLSHGTNVVLISAGDIHVNASITDTGTHGVSLSMLAHTLFGSAGVITVANGVSISSTSGPLSVSLFAGDGSASNIVLGAGSSIITRGGDAYFNRAVVLGTSSGSTGAVSVNTTRGNDPAGAITFAGTIDDHAGASVGLVLTGGAVSLAGSAGATTSLATLQVTDTSTTLGGSIYHTTGDEIFAGPVLLANNVTMTSDSGSVRFVGSQSTIDGATTNGAFSLSLFATSGSATVSLGGSVGGSVELANLFVDPASIVLGSSVYHTTGDQTYSQAVTLGADTSLTSDSGKIRFTGTIDGAHSLGATAGQSIEVVGLIGGSTALTSLSLTGSAVTLHGIGGTNDGVTGTVAVNGTAGISLGGSAYHSGLTQTYTGPVTLLSDLSITSDTANISFVGTGSTINGAHALSLFAATGIVSLGGSVGNGTALASLLVDPVGIVLGGSTYHTTGGQTYSEAVTLGANTALTSDNGNIVFTKTIDGAQSLSVTASHGTAEVDGLIGGATALTTLSVSGGAVKLNGIDHSGSAGVTGGVAVSAATGGITLGEGTYHSGGTQTYTGGVMLLADTVMTADSGDLRFIGTGSTIDGAHALSLFAATGTVSLGGSVGSVVKLTSLFVDPASPTASIILGGASYLTTGNQTYSGAVSLGSDALLASDSGNIHFTSTIDGAHMLSLTAALGGIAVDGLIGGSSALAGFGANAKTVALNGIGNANDGVTGTVGVTGTNGITLGEGTYHSGGTETYTGPVTLLVNTVMTSDSGDLRFVGTQSTINSLDNAHQVSLQLIANSGNGTVSLGGSVGTLAELTSLDVDPGSIVLGGAVYHTSGDQTYSQAVTLGASTSLTSDTGSITFLGTIDGTTVGGQALGATAADTIEVDGLIGGTKPLSALTLDAPTVLLSGIGGEGAGVAGAVSVTGSISLAQGTYHSGGDQTYDGAVDLLANTSVTSDHGSVTFTSTIDGAYALSVLAAQAIAIEGLIGGGTALTNLTLDGDTVSLNGIGGTEDGVTGTVSVTAANGISLDGGTYHSGGDQTYAGPVSLLADTSVTSDSGSVLFGSSIDGAHALTVLASQAIEVDGLIGSITALDSLTFTGNTVQLSGIDHEGSAGVTGTVTISADGGITLYEGTYHSGDTQTYTGPVLLMADTTITSDSGDLRFVGTATTINSGPSDGVFSLSLFAAPDTGTVSLGGSVGDQSALASLYVDPASIILNGAVYNTVGDQTYVQAVTLGTSTSLTSSEGSIFFKSTIDGTDAGGQSLGATAAHAIEVDGLIGGQVALSALTLSGDTVKLSGIDHSGNAGVTGTVSVSGGSGISLDEGTYHSGSDQTYAGPVSLLADTSVTSDTGNVTFTSTINGAHALSVLAQLGMITVDGVIGGSTALTSLD
ncbi:MAG TPA: filamentous hemagglutinin N-terminal domain-containing protein, partial [Stellaceae bacterium]|nr:filamentous hemagglutinin N-terminal domain-containing protein [Stellaceae bacterium]